ncbi:hypothetical protein SAMN02746089_01850 [Caldanaerobius fijiensis DSM 17918]|uniref:SipL SPOCS domain-containing protein n=1 Tax=Caldanaerobius fijiensis DSM 17918 TaxID=1121256 RepID=A0A1M5BD24_9THEO|nr:hypothetical protein [Caldanaerobius fijiensis]SHF40461.1 hypothetical protein SAMN02746089_01850 [Caldanaerobius fijiensis DSM 17918]
MAFNAKTIGSLQVVPGPVEPGQFPEPTEIVCIVADKVYDACSQRICLDNIATSVLVPLVGKTNPQFDRCENITITLLPPGFTVTPLPDRPGFVRIQATFQVTYDIVVKYSDGTEQIVTGTPTTFTKDIVLYLPEPDPNNVKFEAKAECLFGRVNTDNTINVIIGIFIILKAVITVQLLIPSFGFCPTPPECEEFPANVCDEFMHRPFPDMFPPQLWDIIPPYGGK